MASNLPTVVRLTCEICSENEAAWKCENCNKLGCIQCISDHVKQAAPLGHMIATFHGDDQLEITDKDDNYCNIHTKEPFQRYCELCDCLVCFECALTAHSQHKLWSIPEMVQKKRAEYEGILREIKMNSLPALTQIIQNFKQGKEDYDKDVNKILENIDTHAEKLKGEIDHVKDILISQLKAKQVEDIETLSKEQENFEKELANIKCSIELFKSKLQTTKDTEWPTLMKKMKEKLEKCQKPKTSPPIMKPPPLITTQIHQTELKKLFGYLSIDDSDAEKDGDSSSNADEMFSVKVLSRFEGKGPVSCIATRDEDTAWTLQSGQLSLKKQDGTVVKSTSVDFRINDMTVSLFGELLVTDGYNQRLMLLQEEIGKFVGWVDTAPCEPYGICTDDDGDVFVSLGCKELYSEDRIIENHNDTILLILTPSGQVRRKFSRDCELMNSEIFDPYYIDCRDGDLALCHSVGDHCEVICGSFDDINTAKFKYTDKDNEQHNRIVATGLALTSHHLLVSDYYNSSIHVLDKEGDFVKSLMADKDGLHGPTCIARRDDHIWIGTVTGSVFVVKMQV